MYHGNQLSFFLNNQRFQYKPHFVDYWFYFFRINIFTAGSYNHGFDATFNVEHIIFIETSPVSGFKPAVFGENFFYQNAVFVI